MNFRQLLKVVLQETDFLFLGHGDLHLLWVFLSILENKGNEHKEE